jgi:hypothetical protein
MTRASAYARRAQNIKGPSSIAIYFVLRTMTGADPSRGIRGTYTAEEILFDPQPIVDVIKGTVFTSNGLDLKDGDWIVTTLGSQLTEAMIQNPNTFLRAGVAPGGQLLDIFNYTRRDFDGQVMQWILYARGITGQ